MRLSPFLTVTAFCVLPRFALAADTTLTLGAGDDFVVEDSGNIDRLRVDESTGNVEMGTVTLPQTTAPTTAADEGAVYTKDVGGQAELFYRGESNGDEVRLTASGSLAFPVGVVIAYGGSTAPAGWLLCDGAAVSRSTYSALFGIVGTSFGPGDGSTTFDLPDLRQRVPLGKAAAGTGSTLGGTGGTIDHRHTYSTVVSHDHTVNPPTTDSSSIVPHLHPNTATGFNDTADSGIIRRILFDFKELDAASVATTSAGDHNHSVDIGSFSSGITGSASPSTALSNPPYLVVNYIIKY